MKRAFIFIAATLAAVLAISGCASSGFATATQANTDRAKEFQDNILLQAENDLTAIHACYLRSSGYAVIPGTTTIQKVDSTGSAEGCTVMAGMLRTQSNFFTALAPFLARDLMSRVPAAPEEILQAIAEKGMGFALARFGIESVTKLVSSGQAAAYQIAAQAQAKNPITITPGVINTTPDGASVLMPGGASTVNPSTP